MKKIVVFMFISVLAVFTLTGCGKKSSSNDEVSTKDTPAVSLTKTFEKEIKNSSDAMEVAKKISESKVIKAKMMEPQKTTESFLAGFDEEITNYEEAIVISPAISTLPFIAYIFKAEDPEALKEELESKANLRWNICVEADEMKSSIVGNYVFFVMAPNEFE